jgi:hypothetical protein
MDDRTTRDARAAHRVRLPISKASSTQELSAMPERPHRNLFEVLIGQIIQKSEVNIILGKSPNVLLQSKLFEPVRNLQHRSPPGSKPAGPYVLLQKAYKLRSVGQQRTVWHLIGIVGYQR